MKKLTPEEEATLHLVPHGKKHPVHAMIEMLQVGEKLRVTRNDFKWKGKSPSVFVLRLHKTTSARYQIYDEVTKASWVIERVK